MKKKMFNNKYKLTQAVLDGIKTQTRQIVSEGTLRKAIKGVEICGGTIEQRIEEQTPYCFSEEVAIAQSYKDAGFDPHWLFSPEGDGTIIMDTPGWSNKMFVRADLMPHRIKITNIRIEHLQDISEEDCTKEGVRVFKEKYRSYYYVEGIKRKGVTSRYKDENGWHIFKWQTYNSPREAFAVLIDRICGKGTWNTNPYVFVYDFELVK